MDLRVLVVAAFSKPAASSAVPTYEFFLCRSLRAAEGPRQSAQQIGRNHRVLADNLAHDIAGETVQMNRSKNRQQPSFGFCAIIPATMPVRMSPVPPVDIPGFPVVFTHASPSG